MRRDRFFRQAARGNDLVQRGLYPARIERRGGAGRTLQPTMTIGEQKHGVAVRDPQAAQELVRGAGQGYEAVAVAFGVADVHTRPCGIHITHLQAQPFAQTQAEAVEGEEEHAVAQHACGSDDLLDFADRDNIGQTLALGRLDHARGHPRFFQNMGVVELQPVQVEFDGGPGVRADEVGEIGLTFRSSQRARLTSHLGRQVSLVHILSVGRSCGTSEL